MTSAVQQLAVTVPTFTHSGEGASKSSSLRTPSEMKFALYEDMVQHISSLNLTAIIVLCRRNQPKHFGGNINF